MLGSLAAHFLLLAQAAPAAAKTDASPLAQYLPLLAVPVVFYFMLIRPQQQQEKKRVEMMDKLKKNDKVLTSAGIYGTVVSVDNDKVQIRLDDDGKVKATFTRSSVVRILNEPAESKP